MSLSQTSTNEQNRYNNMQLIMATVWLAAARPYACMCKLLEGLMRLRAYNSWDIEP